MDGAKPMKSVPPRVSGVRHELSLCPKAATSVKPRVAALWRLPWARDSTSTATRLRLFRGCSDGRRRNCVAVEIIVFSDTQGSRSGNPALYRRSPVGAKIKRIARPTRHREVILTLIARSNPKQSAFPSGNTLTEDDLSARFGAHTGGLISDKAKRGEREY